MFLRCFGSIGYQIQKLHLVLAHFSSVLQALNIFQIYIYFILRLLGVFFFSLKSIDTELTMRCVLHSRFSERAEE